MRRSCALGVAGLLMGLTGCAGVQHRLCPAKKFASRPLCSPQQPVEYGLPHAVMLTPQTYADVASPAPTSAVAPAPAPAEVGATTAAPAQVPPTPRPTPSPVPVVTPPTPTVPKPPVETPPPPDRPVAPPAPPAPARPQTNPPATAYRWSTLNGRTAVVPDARARSSRSQSDAVVEPSPTELLPSPTNRGGAVEPAAPGLTTDGGEPRLSGPVESPAEGPPSALPLTLNAPAPPVRSVAQPVSESTAPAVRAARWGDSRVAPAPGYETHPRASDAVRRSPAEDVRPDSVERTRVDLSSDGASGVVPATDPVLAGRPRLAQYPVVAPGAPVTVEEPETKPTGWGLHLFSGGHDQTAAPAKRTTAAERFAKRIRGAARAFVDPELVRGETSDLPQ